MTIWYKDDNIKVTRHYYSQHSRSFETSLDVYTPSSSSSSRITSIVVLVVGSAWMGHTPWIYNLTSWWNSAGPRSIARTGSSICICVRHRGAFFHVPPSSSLSLIQESFWPVVLCMLIMLLLFGKTTVFTSLVAFSCLWIGLHMMGQGSATFPDMQDDVEQAIQWIQQNKQTLCTSTNHAKEISVYFGGYSSGAHVALTVLQRSSKQLSFFQGIVLISGVLADRPEECLIESSSSKAPPRVLTDLLLRLVFGSEAAKTIPSPIADTIPHLPHLIIGCEQEMLGIPLLDVFFCSRDYVKKARQQGIPVQYQEIKSDHWFILSHHELQRILAKELPRLSHSNGSIIG